MKKQLALATILSIGLATVLFPFLTVFVKPGYIYFRDVTEGLSVDNLYQRYIYTYSNDIGESLAEKARIPLFYTIISIFQLSGMPDSSYVKIKILFLVTLTFLTFAVCAYKFLRFVHTPEQNQAWAMLTTATLGALIYTTNFWFTNRLLHFYLFFASVTIPVTFYLLYTYLFSEKPIFSKLVVLALVQCIFTATPHVVLFEMLLTLSLAGVYIATSSNSMHTKSIHIGGLLAYGILYALVNAYWILPFALTQSVPDAVLSETIVKALGKNASLLNSLKLTGYWLEGSQSYLVIKNNLLNIVFLVPLVLSLAALFVARKTRNVTLFSALAGILVAAAGLATQAKLTNSVYFYLMFHSPIKSVGWLFREYDKFGIIIAFVYSLLIAYLGYKSFSAKRFRLLFIGAVSIVLTTYFAYMFKVLHTYYTPQSIPTEFNQVVELLEADPEETNTLWFPGTPQPIWAARETEEVRYVFANLISPKPSLTTRSDLINFFEYLFEEENIYSLDLGTVLDLVGVKYMVLRKDDTSINITEIEQQLDAQKSLKKVYAGNLLNVYENTKYTGLAKVYDSSLVSSLGLKTYNKLDDMNFDSTRTFLDFTDKVAENTFESTSSVLLASSSRKLLEFGIKDYTAKLIFPRQYSTVKDDGIQGKWVFGSLENLKHAETKFFFERLGLNVTQYDYQNGVVLARDGWEMDPNKKSTPRMIKMENPSDRFSVSGITAIRIRTTINENNNISVHFFDQTGQLVWVAPVFPNDRGNIDTIVKTPERAALAELKYETASEARLTLQDVSQNVRKPSFSFKFRPSCTDSCILYARILKSYMGGKLQITVGPTTFDVPTKLEENTLDEDKYDWVEIGKVEQLSSSKETTITLTNDSGFNSVNALLLLNASEQAALNTKVREYGERYKTRGAEATEQTPPRASVSQINPTEYRVTLSGCVKNCHGILAFAKPYSNAWNFSGTKTAPILVNGYIMGWDITGLQDGTYTIEHKPQTYFYIGTGISVGVIATLALYFCGTKLVRLSVRKSNSQG